MMVSCDVSPNGSLCSPSTLVLKHYQAKKNGPLMGQVFLDSSDQCGTGMGCQNLRKWEKKLNLVQKLVKNT